jgi:hypothetical protein
MPKLNRFISWTCAFLLNFTMLLIMLFGNSYTLATNGDPTLFNLYMCVVAWFVFTCGLCTYNLIKLTRS